MHNGDMPKDGTPATQGDLKKAVAELKGDLGGVNDRLGGLNTRFSGVNTRFNEVNTRISEVSTRLNEVNNRLCKEIIATRVMVTDLRDDLTAVIRLSHSQIMSKLDTFMGQTRTVHTDQVFLIHRVDKLEKKVGALESRGR